MLCATVTRSEYGLHKAPSPSKYKQATSFAFVHGIALGFGTVVTFEAENKIKKKRIVKYVYRYVLFYQYRMLK